MTDLKNYLWNNKNNTSVKTKFNGKILKINEWPDFGFVGCPKEYIVLSAYLIKQPIQYNQLKAISKCDVETINHFLYVCHMLKLLIVSEPKRENIKESIVSIFTTDISSKLRQIFY
ncbi:MAG: hypothetical protein KDI92_15665 [Xanthomonadales bacterium]|nr:hypothetical protein [Xanthomonadales bacterium]